MLARMNLKHVLRRNATALLALLCAQAPSASVAGSLPDNAVRAEVLPGWQTESGTRMAALRLSLAPGWKTYWRAPGDAGIPPRFDWRGSDNLGGVSYHWPRPEVFTSFGLRSVGYKDELILPLELHPGQPGQPIRLRGRIDLGICENICVPANLEIEALLDGPGRPDPDIRRALADQPRPAARAGVGKVTCALAPAPDGLRLTARIEMPRLSGKEYALVEAGDPRIWVSEPEVSRKGGALTVAADIAPPAGTPLALDRSALRFTVIAGQNAVDIRGCSAQ